MKSLSKQESTWINNMCEDIRISHFSGNVNVKHYACLMRHGRGKSCREKGG